MRDTATISFKCPGQAATEAIAATLSALVGTECLIALTGDLGAGKTTFARAFIRARLQNEEAEVPSPTFTLLQTYDTPDGSEIWHADLYRLSDPEEVYELGLDEARTEAVCLIEWPDRMPADWWDNALEISLEITEEGTRSVTISGAQDQWASLISGIAG